MERYRTFKQFWPFYVSQHMKPWNRKLHFIGTTLVLACLCASVWSKWFLATAPLAGYGFAWIGHFFIEKNRPATFTYPFWSLIGDFKMYWLMWRGKM